MPRKSEGRLHDSRETSSFSGWLFDFGVPGMDFDAEMIGMYLHKTEDRRVYPAQDERVHV